jgi:hypothetical protein
MGWKEEWMDGSKNLLMLVRWGMNITRNKKRKRNGYLANRWKVLVGNKNKRRKKTPITFRL